MGTYFGATLPRNPVPKVKLLLIGSAGLFAAFFGCVSLISHDSREPQHALGFLRTKPDAHIKAETPQTEVLVARVPIEQDTVLSAELFSTIKMDEADVPLGAIRAAQAKQVYNKFAGNVIAPYVPLTLNDISYRPRELLIPTGHRAISVNARDNGVIQANSKVDVLLTFSQNGIAKITTLSSMAKVLAVNSNSSPGERIVQTTPKNFTLLVQAADASRIELAKSMGEISLKLPSQNPAKEEPLDLSADSASIVLEASATEPQKSADGNKQNRVLIKDALGKTRVYVLNETGGAWVLDSKSS